MSISYPLTLPAGHRRSLSFRPYSVVAMSMSPFTLQQQAQAHQGQIWIVRVTLTPMQRADAEEWIGALLSLNGRYGTFYLGDDTAKTPRGSLLTGAVTGATTQANTSLCCEAGKAFLDLTGVDLTPHLGKRIVITDSAGKTMSGWIKAAGTTITYGSDLVTNGGFDDDSPPSTAGWTEDVGSIASVAGGQSGYGLEVTAAGGTGGSGDVPQQSGDVPFQSGDVPWAGAGGSAEQPIVTQAIAAQPSGRLYRLSGAAKSGTAGAGSALLGFTHSGGTRSGTVVTSGVWQFITIEHMTAPAAAGVLTAIWLQDAASAAGTMLFDTITLHQILTPSATGVTIVSASGGSTYQWEAEESGFNRDDPAGYTFTIPNTTGQATVKGAGQTGMSLITEGWLPNATGVLLRGDWIQLGTGSTQRIYRVVQDVNADANGEATIEIWPRLRESPADNAALTLTNTAGVFRLTHNEIAWDIDNDLLYGLELEAAEAL